MDLPNASRAPRREASRPRAAEHSTLDGRGRARRGTLPAGAPGRPYRVGFLLLDGFALLSYAAAVEPLRAANLLAGRALYAVREIPAEGALATSSGGAQVRAGAQLGEAVDFDLVLVVAGGDPSAFVSRRATRWLRHLARRGVVIGGVSGGPVVLARAGVMGGRRMTVHWEHRALLGATEPAPIVERSRYVIDRDRLTCAGGTAALDMMHALIARHHGARFAREVSDWFLHADVRTSADPQRSGPAERWGAVPPTLLAALEAMENHVGDPLELAQLAAVAGVGTRQLNRLCRAHFETSVGALYRRVRLEKARALLERSALPIGEVARATGFPSAAHFARRFGAAYGATPSAWRRDRAAR